MHRIFTPTLLALLLLLGANTAHARWPVLFGSTSDDYVHAMVSDGAGNVYMSINFYGSINFLGTTLNSGQVRAIALAKVNESSGDLVWVRVVSTTKDVEAPALRYGNNAVYLGGSFAGSITITNNNLSIITLTSQGGYDCFVAKYTTSGHCHWARRMGGSGHDRINTLALYTAANRVLAGGGYKGGFTFAGASFTSAGRSDGFMAEWTDAGAENRCHAIYGPGDENVKDLMVDGHEIWMCGSLGNGATVCQNNIQYTNGAGQDGFVLRSVLNYSSPPGSIFSSTALVNLIGSSGDDETNAISWTNEGLVVAATTVATSLVWKGQGYTSLGGSDIMLTNYLINLNLPYEGRIIGSPGNDYANRLAWCPDYWTLMLAASVSGPISNGAWTMTPLGGQDAMMMRIDQNGVKPIGGKLLGGAGNDAGLAISWSSSTYNVLFGGAFSGSAIIPPLKRATTSAGALDGFATSIPWNSAWFRMASEETEFELTSQMKPYPSPATRTLRMGVAYAEAGTIRVLDAKGNIIAVPVSDDGGEAVLDVSALPVGLYSVRAGGQVGRFAKE